MLLDLKHVATDLYLGLEDVRPDENANIATDQCF